MNGDLGDHNPALELPPGDLYLKVGTTATRVNFTEGDLINALQSVSIVLGNVRCQADVVAAWEHAAGNSNIYSVCPRKSLR